MTVVFSKKHNEQQTAASTTKLMTALVCYELISDLSAKITFQSIDLVESNESRLNALAGDQITYLDALYALVLASANDCAKCLARSLSGSVANFVSAMNTKAVSIGMTNTNFADPSGSNPLTVTTADDMQKLMRAYSQIPLLVTIGGTINYTVSVIGVNARTIDIEHTIKPHTHRFPEILAAKTGTATFGNWNDSGGCIVVLWKLPNDQKRISVILGSGVGINDRYDDLRALMDYEIARSRS